MLTIKFARRGKKNQSLFRLIIQEKFKDPFGDFLEDLGFYNPRTKQISLKQERIKYWLSKGAQPTNSVHNLLVKEKIIEGAKIKVTKIYRKKEEPAKEVKKEVKEGDVNKQA